MFVYVGRNYRAAVSGTVIKDVRCEKCGCEYLYRMIRRGEGSGSSPYYLNNEGAQRRANAGAKRQLQKLLARGVDPVACPDCGWLQAQMVRELRRRSLRGLIYTAITLAIVLPVFAFIYALNVTHDFRRSLQQDDQIVLIVTAAALIGGVVGPIWLRRAILRSRDPNRNHPQPPDPIPGAPKPVRKSEYLQPFDPAAGTPAELIDDDEQIAYERRPPEVEPGGWITVQLLHPPLPQLCCYCLNPTNTISLYNYGGTLVKMPVRICKPCTRRFWMMRFGWTIVALVVSLAVAYGATLLAGRMKDDERIAYTVAGGIIGTIVGLVIAVKIAAPVTLGRFNSSLNTIRVRFKNRNYVSTFLAAQPDARPTPEFTVNIPRPHRHSTPPRGLTT